MSNLAVPLSPVYINSPEKLARGAAEWAAAPALAIDTESNSLHSYSERTALIQISTRQRDYLVDPLALTDLSLLAPPLADPAIEKVFHAAENDILGLKRDFGFQVYNVFDTMWASRILGIPRIGLADLLREHFGVTADKRMQRYDWNTRPLDPAALTYAVEDTHYLLALRDILYDQLVAADRWEEARQEFERLGRVTPTLRTFDSEGFWRVKGVYDIQPRERAILRELYRFRDDQARENDRPPFKVLADSLLIELSKAQPRTVDELRRSQILTPYLLRRFGRGIVEAVRAGLEAPIPQRPRDHDRPDDVILERFETLRAWRKSTGAARGVDPDVVLSNAALWTLARQAPQTPEALAALDVMSEYKLGVYGQGILALLGGNGTTDKSKAKADAR
ncbi:MAG: HRDC domain-containing protein [Anaerolineae bacterium]|nr:HRDC domain-containing protein [Anaerolineae bacterium]